MQKLPLHSQKVTPPPTVLPVLQKLKSVYLLWFGFYQVLPKVHRHTIGQRVDDLFVECMEAVSLAAFSKGPEKILPVRLAIQKIDTAKLLLLALWETKSLDNKKFIALSEKLNEIGQNLGGWHGSVLKKNSPVAKTGEK